MMQAMIKDNFFTNIIFKAGQAIFGGLSKFAIFSAFALLGLFVFLVILAAIVLPFFPFGLIITAWHYWHTNQVEQLHNLYYFLECMKSAALVIVSFLGVVVLIKNILKKDK